MLRWNLLLDLNLGCQSVIYLILLSMVLILIVVVVEFPNSPVGPTIVLLLVTKASRFVSCSADLVSFLIVTCWIVYVLWGWSCSRGGPIFGRGSIARSHSSCLWLDNLLCFRSLILLHFFILVLVHFLWAIVRNTTSHLLSHHLLESAILTCLSTKLEELLWLWTLFIRILLSKFVNVWFRQVLIQMWLPLAIIKFFEGLSFWEYFSPVCSEYLEAIINLQSFIEYWIEQVATACTPQ